MRKRVVVIAALVAVVGIARAQSASDGPSPDSRFIVQWEKKPTARDFEKNYPRIALDQGIVGAADLCCTPLPDRTPACTVGFDWPKGYGFGEGAVEMAKNFRMTESSYQEFKSNPSNWMQIPIRFSIWTSSEKNRKEIESIFNKLREDSLGLCKSSRPIS